MFRSEGVGICRRFYVTSRGYVERPASFAPPLVDMSNAPPASLRLWWILLRVTLNRLPGTFRRHVSTGRHQTRPGLAGSVSELKPLGKRGDDRRRSLPALLGAWNKALRNSDQWSPDANFQSFCNSFDVFLARRRILCLLRRPRDFLTAALCFTILGRSWSRRF